MHLRAIAATASLLLCAGDANAGSQLFEGSWVVKAFGNERTGGAGESEFYSAVGVPFGRQCNAKQPRCPFQSTPTNGTGRFDPLGGSLDHAIFCTPYTVFGPVRHTKNYGGTASNPLWRLYQPPLFRNTAFFTPGGSPNANHCDPRSTSLGGYGSLGGGPGAAQAGQPLTGKGIASTHGSGVRAFDVPLAQLPHQGPNGIRGTHIIGELPFNESFPYRYTYATLRNATGAFGAGQGPGSFSIPHVVNGETVARVAAKQGVAKFGGTMRMLGVLHTRACHHRAYGCSLGGSNWHYDVIGAAAQTVDGAVTRGYQVLDSEFNFVTYLGQITTVMIEGSRFPWTTGSVTVTAAGGGDHKTVHYARGYDNRTPTSGRGTIQLVSPTLTRWRLPFYDRATAGIGILRIRFLPEPRAWAMLAAGAGLLAVAARCRRP